MNGTPRHGPTPPDRAPGGYAADHVHSDHMEPVDTIRSGFTLRLAQSYEPDRFQGVHAGRDAQRTPPYPVRAVEDINEVRSSARPSTIDRLLAGRVFESQGSPKTQSRTQPSDRQSSREPLPMHPHPADRNIAATGVSLGRSLDVTA